MDIYGSALHIAFPLCLRSFSNLLSLLPSLAWTNLICDNSKSSFLLLERIGSKARPKRFYEPQEQLPKLQTFFQLMLFFSCFHAPLVLEVIKAILKNSFLRLVLSIS